MCTLEKHGNIFVLTLTGADDHRFNPSLLDSIQAALRRVCTEVSTSSSALITTAHGKYFSNGYDLAWAASGSGPSESEARTHLMVAKLKDVVADFISLPMPIIAAVTGHASAGGFILALIHDYVLMRKDRGFLYMSELDINLVMPSWFMSVIQAKIGSPAARRDVVLRAEKVTAEAALAKGIIHSAHDNAEETLKAAVRLGEELAGRKWNGKVYGQMRVKALAPVLEAIELDDTGKEATPNAASKL